MSRQRVGQRASKLFGVTLREPPAETDTASHALLVRAGYVRQLAAGIFSHLPPNLSLIHISEPTRPY